MGNGGGSVKAYYGGGDTITTVCGKDTHGASVTILYSGGIFRHIRVDTSEITTPRVEIFADGIKVGCTFIYADAMRKLTQEWQAFMVAQSKVIQP